MTFDPSRPYGSVQGIPGVVYQQNGRYYRRDGSLVDGDPERDQEIRDLRARLGDPEMEPEVRAAMRERLAALAAKPVEPVRVAAEPAFRDDMRLAENKRLRAMMDQYGQEWQGADHARRFIEGKA